MRLCRLAAIVALAFLAAGDVPQQQPAQEGAASPAAKPDAAAPQQQGTPPATPPPSDAPPATPPAAPAAGHQQPQLQLVTTRGPSAVIMVPVTIFTLWLLQNLFAPDALDAGGPVAAFIAAALPHSLLFPASHGERGSRKRRAYEWLLGPDAVSRHETLYCDPEHGPPSSTSSSPSRPRKSNATDWFTGGRLGKKSTFQFVPMDPPPVAQPPQQDTPAAAPRPDTPPDSAANIRSFFHAPALPSAGVVREGFSSAVAAVAQQLAPDATPQSPDRLEGAEEVARTRLQRVEAEDRLIAVRLGRASRAKAAQRETDRLAVHLREDEAEARVSLGAEEDECYSGLEQLHLRLLLQAYHEQDVSRLLRQEAGQREAVSDDEMLAFSSDIRAAARHSVVLVVTRPARMEILRTEHSARADLEDLEDGSYVYLQRLAVCGLVEAAEAEARATVTQSWAEGFGSQAAEAGGALLQALGVAEAARRGAAAAEEAEAFWRLGQLQRLLRVGAEEASARAGGVGREERRARSACAIEEREVRCALLLRQAVAALCGEAEEASALLEGSEGEARCAVARCAALSLQEAAEAEGRRGVEGLARSGRAGIAEAHHAELAELLSEQAELLAQIHEAARAALAAEADAEAEALEVEEGGAREALLGPFRSGVDRMVEWRRGLEAEVAESVAALEQHEGVAREEAGEEEVSARAAVLQAEPDERVEAEGRAARRLEELAGYLSVLEAEEGEGRSAFVRAAREVFRDMRREFHVGLEEVALHDMLASVRDLEAGLRADQEAEEASVLAQLAQVEYQERAAVNERLVREGSTATSAAATQDRVVRMQVVADAALVRAGFARNSQKVGMIHKGEVYHVVERRGNRAKLREVDGWVSVAGQTGDMILQDVTSTAGEDGDEGDPPEVPVPAAPSAAEGAQVPQAEVAPGDSQQEGDAAADAMQAGIAQVSASFGKGWTSLTDTLGQVRLPTPMSAKPKKKSLSGKRVQ